MDSSKQINDLIDMTTRLNDLLKRENEALRSHNAQEATALLSEKNSLSEVYEDHVKAVMSHPGQLDGLDISVKERLKGIGDNAKALIEENAILLRAAIVANQRVLDMVAEALNKSRKNVTTYSADGSVAKAQSLKPMKSVALAIDHSL